MGSTTIAVTGIGGIGKTELLYEISRLNHGQRNVFYFPASDQKSLDKAYEEIAHRIGPEILADRRSIARDFVSDWRLMEPHQRVYEFRVWLEGENNQDSLILLDDLDGLGDMDSIREAFPRNSGVVLYSSRNPYLERLGPRLQPRVLLSPLSEAQIVEIMKEECAAHGEQNLGDLKDPEILTQIASRVQGHPLIASQAVKYMREKLSIRSQCPGQTILDMWDDSNRSRMRRFLDYRPSGARSILETFQTLIHRLQPKENNDAWNLMLLISHLQADNSIADFRGFSSLDQTSKAFHSLKDLMFPV